LMRAVRTVPNHNKLRILRLFNKPVRLRGISFVVKRETAQTIR